MAILFKQKIITTPNETMKAFQGIAKSIRATLSALRETLDVLVIDGVPDGFLIGILEMEKLNACIDSGGQYVDFTVGRKFIWAGIEPDCTVDRMQGYESEKKALP